MIYTRSERISESAIEEINQVEEAQGAPIDKSCLDGVKPSVTFILKSYLHKYRNHYSAAWLMRLAKNPKEKKKYENICLRMGDDFILRDKDNTEMERKLMKIFEKACFPFMIQDFGGLKNYDRLAASRPHPAADRLKTDKELSLTSMSDKDFNQLISYLANDAKYNPDSAYIRGNPVAIVKEWYLVAPKKYCKTIEQAKDIFIRNLKEGDAWTCRVMARYLMLYEPGEPFPLPGIDREKEGMYYLELGSCDQFSENNAGYCADLLKLIREGYRFMEANWKVMDKYDKMEEEE
jgi:hypothetical protein